MKKIINTNALEIKTTLSNVLGKVGFTGTLVAVGLVLLGACTSPTESSEPKAKAPITIAHPTACIYMDSLNVSYIKRLESYTLKVSPLSRARCHGEDGYITCSSKSADTLYTVETACPVKAVR